MNLERQEKAIDALRDWSKWLISLNTISFGGCAFMVAQGASSVIKPFLVFAIILFALAIVTAAIMLGALVSVVQGLPLQTETGKASSIFDHIVWRRTSLGQLVKLQVGLFGAGLVLVLIWIILKPTVG